MLHDVHVAVFVCQYVRIAQLRQNLFQLIVHNGQLEVGDEVGNQFGQSFFVAGDFLVFGVIFAELILVIAQFKGQHADGIIRMVQEIAFGRKSFFVQVIQGFLQDALM